MPTVQVSVADALGAAARNVREEKGIPRRALLHSKLFVTHCSVVAGHQLPLEFSRVAPGLKLSARHVQRGTINS